MTTTLTRLATAAVLALATAVPLLAAPPAEALGPDFSNWRPDIRVKYLSHDSNMVAGYQIVFYTFSAKNIGLLHAQGVKVTAFAVWKGPNCPPHSGCGPEVERYTIPMIKVGEEVMIKVTCHAKLPKWTCYGAEVGTSTPGDTAPINDKASYPDDNPPW